MWKIQYIKKSSVYQSGPSTLILISKGHRYKYHWGKLDSRSTNLSEEVWNIALNLYWDKNEDTQCQSQFFLVWAPPTTEKCVMYQHTIREWERLVFHFLRFVGLHHQLKWETSRGKQSYNCKADKNWVLFCYQIKNESWKGNENRKRQGLALLFFAASLASYPQCP